MELSIVVPGLLGPPPELADPVRWLEAATTGLALNAIVRLLSRSQHGADPYADRAIEGIVCRSLGLVEDGSGDWPVATFSYRDDGGDAACHSCMRADPVHMSAGLAEVSLIAGDELALRPAHAQALAAEVNAHLEHDPATVEALSASRWYVRAEGIPLVGMGPPSLALGGMTQDFVPLGDQAGYWRRWLNEVQMVLHASSVNEERLRAGQLSVNSLWLWGAAEAPGLVCGRWEAVTTDCALARALARGSNTPVEPLPSDLQEWIENAPPAKRRLLVLPELYLPVVRQDIENWRQRLSQLESRWFSPLLAALVDGGVSRLVLHHGFGQAYSTTATQQRQFWRRDRGLAGVLEQEVSAVR